MAGFEGKWNLDSSENFEAYMEAVGVNWMTRKLGASAKPVVTISREGDLWKYKQESTVKSAGFEFKFGQEFDETTADGRKVKTEIESCKLCNYLSDFTENRRICRSGKMTMTKNSTITQDSPTKWTQIQKGDVPSTLTRELIDSNTLKLIVSAKDVTSTRIYKRAT